MATVYMGRLPRDVRERDIEKFFRGYGRLKDIFIKNGYAFIDFYDRRDADDAIYDLNGKELLGDRVLLERAKGGGPRGSDRERVNRRRSRSRSRDRDRRPPWMEKYGPPVRTKYRVVVENLSSRVSWQDLKDYMRDAGDVTYCDVNHRRGEGIVEFATRSDMKRAIDKLDDTMISDKRIRLIEDKAGSRSRSRSASRSRSRSKSRSRTRSRSRSHGGKSASRSRSRSIDRHNGGDDDNNDDSMAVDDKDDQKPATNGNDRPTRSRSRSSAGSGRDGYSRSRSRSASRD